MPLEGNIPVEGDVLGYNGSLWVPVAVEGVGAGVSELNDLSDVTTEGATEGDSLVFNGEGWSPTTLQSGAGLSKIVIPVINTSSLNGILKGQAVTVYLNRDSAAYNEDTEEWEYANNINELPDTAYLAEGSGFDFNVPLSLIGVAEETIPPTQFDGDDVIYNSGNVVLYGEIEELDTATMFAAAPTTISLVVANADGDLSNAADGDIYFEIAKITYVDAEEGKIFVNPKLTAANASFTFEV
jgi:hypothetical protein